MSPIYFHRVQQKWNLICTSRGGCLHNITAIDSQRVSGIHCTSLSMSGNEVSLNEK